MILFSRLAIMTNSSGDIHKSDRWTTIRLYGVGSSPCQQRRSTHVESIVKRGRVCPMSSISTWWGSVIIGGIDSNPCAVNIWQIWEQMTCISKPYDTWWKNAIRHVTCGGSFVNITRRTSENWFRRWSQEPVNMLRSEALWFPQFIPTVTRNSTSVRNWLHQDDEKKATTTA